MAAHQDQVALLTCESTSLSACRSQIAPIGTDKRLEDFGRTRLRNHGHLGAQWDWTWGGLELKLQGSRAYARIAENDSRC